MTEITPEEMFKLMEEDAKNSQLEMIMPVILTPKQEKIYQQALSDGFIDLGVPGVPLDNDTNIVVDQLNLKYILTSEMVDNNITITKDEQIVVVEERPQTFCLFIKEVKK